MGPRRQRGEYSDPVGLRTHLPSSASARFFSFASPFFVGARRERHYNELNKTHGSGGGMEDTIGWVGLGKMGLPMAQRLRESGQRMLVWARNPEQTLALRKQ